MNEQNVTIEVNATAEVKVNGVVVPEVSIQIKKATLIVEDFQVSVPSVNVSQAAV